MEYCAVCGRELNEENKYMKNLCWDCKFGDYDEYVKDKNRDWDGNSKSTFVTLGASNHCEHDRAENDFYATDPKALEIFLDRIKKDNIKFHHDIWECACGEGHLSKVLINQGFHVYSSDLIDRGYGEQQDFLQVQNIKDLHYDILTNPPYNKANLFVEKALDLVANGYYVIMFLKIQFLEGKERRKLFDKYPPKYVYVNSARQICYLNGDDSKKMSSAACYCWFVWEKGFKGEPIIRWI